MWDETRDFVQAMMGEPTFASAVRRNFPYSRSHDKFSRRQLEPRLHHDARHSYSRLARTIPGCRMVAGSGPTDRTGLPLLPGTNGTGALFGRLLRT